MFTLGSDDKSYEHTYYSQPRRIKPYIVRAAQVCHRWRRITQWKPNSYFWVTELTLTLVSPRENDNLSQHNHHVLTVTTFRHARSTIKDSDITLVWEYQSNLSVTDRAACSRIFMHCVAMLSEYSRQ